MMISSYLISNLLSIKLYIANSKIKNIKFKNRKHEMFKFGTSKKLNSNLEYQKFGIINIETKNFGI